MPVQVKTPDYLREHGYKSPTDNLNCPFQSAFATDLPFYDHLIQNQETLKAFNIFMAGKSGSRKPWIEWFPVESQFLYTIPNAENDTTLLVDVGGGQGHDLERFLSKYPQTKGRLILQDLPNSLNTIQQLSPGIHRMPHDFFTMQPVKGEESRVNSGSELYLLTFVKAHELIIRIIFSIIGQMLIADSFCRISCR